MAVEVRMPAYSESMEEADVVGWLVAPGDHVNEGDPIAEIETDKATGELESPVTGVLSEIIVAQGSQGVKVGELLALIEPTADAEEEAPDPARAEPAGPAAGPARGRNVSGAARTSARTPAPTPAPSPTPTPRTTPAAATALARRLADRAGIDLSTITGSGASGRIVKADVASVSSGASGTDAQRAGAAWASPAQHAAPAAELHLRVACHADRATEVCERLSALEPDTRVPLRALIIRAAAGALREVPEANVVWIAGELVRQEESLVALGLPTGRAGDLTLVRDADRMGLAELAEQIAASASPLAAGATAAALSLVDVGDTDVESIQLSVGPPSVCVLGIGAPVESPVAVNGQLGVALVLRCTLAADSRALTPASAARLLAAFKQRIEDPLEMILH